METRTFNHWLRIQYCAFLLVGLVGVLGRVAYIDRPMDHRSLNSWREADYTQVARNFYRGNLNILYPQIDWRGTTPGYAEMEFPVVPWIAAVLDRVFGYHEAWVRAPSAIAAILGLLLFMRLCRQLLPPIGALLAATAFAANPLLIHLATSMQPESVMIVLSLLAITLILIWDEHPRRLTFFAACVTIAAAVLAKSPAAYLGLIFGYLVVRKYGWRTFSDVWNYAGALIALLPPLAWYIWAHKFWVLHGISLGVSNESHFIGWDMLVPPKFLLGILRLETLNVFTPAGWVLAAVGVWTLRPRIQLLSVWCCCVGLFYIVAGRTSGDAWAYYYHASSVAPACLLMGAGFSALATCRSQYVGIALQRKTQRWTAVFLAAATVLSLIVVTAWRIHNRDSNANRQAMRLCAMEFVPHISPTDMVVVRGGSSVDEYGKPVAFNESMVFTWMDRKGFNYPSDQLDLPALARIANQGGRFWFVNETDMAPGRLGQLVDGRYRRVDSCGGNYFLYDLWHR